MQNNILLLPLRGNIIWDSVREISLAKKIINSHPKENVSIYYPCGKIIFDLFQNNKYIKPIYIKELDSFNSIKISKFTKILKLIIVCYKIIWLNKNFSKIIYSWSLVKIRYISAKIIAFFLRANFETQNFEQAKNNYCELFFTEKENSNIKEFTLNNEKPSISICIESTDKNRMWEKKKYIQLIKKLYLDYNIYLIWIDKKYNQEIIDTFWTNIINLVWKLNIRETSLIIKNSKYFIWNDSWLAHIASWVNTNIIIITLTNTIDQNYVYNNKATTKVEILNNPKINNILNIIYEKNTWKI